MDLIKNLRKDHPYLTGFGTVLVKIETRIRKEKIILYPEYLK